MGHGEPNAGLPTLHVTIVDGEFIYRIELAVGQELRLGHVAMAPLERLTETEWYACLAAAKKGWGELYGALQGTMAAAWIDRLISRATQAGVWMPVRTLLLRRLTTTWAVLNNRAALDAHRELLAP